MKTRFLLCATTAALLFLTACIPSVYSFYRTEDVAFDTRLLGSWRAKGKSGGPHLWEFRRGEDQSYTLITTEKEGKQGSFNARLFKLKGELFLDIVPSDCEFDSEQGELVAFAMFTGHLLIRVTQIEPTLKLAFCNYEWLGEHLEKNPGALAHHVESKRTVLTANTRDLQRFVLKHLAEGELFQQPEEYAREEAAESAKGQ